MGGQDRGSEKYNYFLSRSGLYLCEKTHQGYESWQHVCPECSKRFISKQKLTMHIR